MPVIPNGITHDFVILTNKKAQTAFSPFGLLIVELAGLEPATLCLQSRCATSCAIAPLEHENHYRYFHTPGSLRRSFAAFTNQAKNTPINNSFKVFFKSTYLADCWNKLPLQWA